MECIVCCQVQAEGAAVFTNPDGTLVCFTCAATVLVEVTLTPDLFISCKTTIRIQSQQSLCLILRRSAVPLSLSPNECPLCQSSFQSSQHVLSHLNTGSCKTLTFSCVHCNAVLPSLQSAKKHLHSECFCVQCGECSFQGSAPAYLRHKLQSVVQKRLFQLMQTLNHSFRRDLLSPDTFAVGSAVSHVVHRTLNAVVGVVEGDAGVLRSLPAVLPPVLDVSFSPLRCDSAAWHVEYEGTRILPA